MIGSRSNKKLSCHDDVGKIRKNNIEPGKRGEFIQKVGRKRIWAHDTRAQHTPCLLNNVKSQVALKYVFATKWQICQDEFD